MPALKKFTIALAVMGGLAGPALAQDAGTAAPAAGADAASGLSMGETHDNNPKPGQAYAKEEIGDWTLQCIKTADGQNEPCQLYQLLKDKDGNSVAEITLFKVENAGQAVAGANIMAPLETMLPAGVVLSTDGGTAKKYPFSVCTKVGCLAQVGFTQDELDTMKKGQETKLEIRPFAAPNVTVDLSISLKGLTAGFEKTTATHDGDAKPHQQAPKQ